MKVSTIKQRIDPGAVLESEERQMGDRRVGQEGRTIDDKGHERDEVNVTLRDARRLGRMAKAMGIVLPTMPAAYRTLGPGTGPQLASPARSTFHPRPHPPMTGSSGSVDQRYIPSSTGSSSSYMRPNLHTHTSSKSLLSPIPSPLEPSPSNTSLPTRRAGSALSHRSAHSARSARSGPSSVGGSQRYANTRSSPFHHQAQFLIKVVPPDHMFIPPTSTDVEGTYISDGYGTLTPSLSTETGKTSLDGMIASPVSYVSQAKQVDRWRKGKILPLKPNLDAMVKQVVEQWGLPSGIGIVMYLTRLADDTSAKSDSDDQVDGEENGGQEENDLIGSEIGKEAWKIIWSPYYASARREAQMAMLAGTHKGMKRLRTQGSVISASSQRRSMEPLRLATPSSETEILQSPFKDQPSSGFLTPASTQLSFQSQLPGASPGSSSIAPSASASQAGSPSKSTPLSLLGRNGGMPKSVLGTLEFDVDLSRPGSEWYTAWMKRRRETAGVKSARQAAMEKGGNGSRPKLKELSLKPGGSAFASSDYQVLEDDDANSDQPPHTGGLLDGTGFGSDEDDLMSLSISRKLRLDSTHTEREINIQDIGTQRVLGSDISLEQIGHRPGMSRQASVNQDVAEIAAMLGVKPEDLQSHLREGAGGALAVSPSYLQNGLASPIALPSPHNPTTPSTAPQMHLLHAAAFGQMPDNLEAHADGPDMVGLGVGLTREHMRASVDRREVSRESTVIMRDKLDDLERVLRALSPRHLRFSTLPSPGSAILEANGQFPERLPDENDAVTRPLRTSSRPARQKPSLSLVQTGVQTPSISSSPDSDSPPTNTASTWPAVPFIKTPENSPLLPQEVTFVRSMDPRKLTPRSAPEGSAPIPLSPETMMRMEYESVGLAPAMPSAHRPLRPARPPSPMLDIYAAPSPPLRLDVHPDDMQGNQSLETASYPQPFTTKKMDGPPPGRAVKKQKSVGRLNQLFQRKVSETGSSAAPLKITSGPPMPASRAGSSSVDLTSPTFTSPTPDEFGGMAGTSDGKGATFPMKSPKAGGFGRRLLSGLHTRTLSSSDKKEMEEVLAAQKKAMGMVSPERPPVPALPWKHNPTAQIPSHASLHRIMSQSAASPPFDFDQSVSPPDSPSRSMHPTSPTIATSPSSVRRKPVPRASGDDSLPTSISSGSLSFGGMGGMAKSASGTSIQAMTLGKSQGNKS